MDFLCFLSQISIIITGAHQKREVAVCDMTSVKALKKRQKFQKNPQ